VVELERKSSIKDTELVERYIKQGQNFVDGLGLSTILDPTITLPKPDQKPPIQSQQDPSPTTKREEITQNTTQQLGQQAASNFRASDESIAEDQTTIFVRQKNNLQHSNQPVHVLQTSY